MSTKWFVKNGYWGNDVMVISGGEDVLPVIRALNAGWGDYLSMCLVGLIDRLITGDRPLRSGGRAWYADEDVS